MGDCRESQDRGEQALELAREFAAALLYGDESAAERTIREAIDAGLSTAEIDDEVIAPAMWLIGKLWERGEISVADEHLATDISLRMIAMQREARRLARSRRGHRVMLAAPTGELHVVALRMVANLLREAGYDVLELGADVPAEALAASALRHEPSVICLSATMPGGAEVVRHVMAEVQREWPATAFVIGGRALGTRLRPRPRLEVCERVTEVVECVDAMVKRADLN